jgi:hypothetical protein
VKKKKREKKGKNRPELSRFVAATLKCCERKVFRSGPPSICLFSLGFSLGFRYLRFRSLGFRYLGFKCAAKGRCIGPALLAFVCLV